jgi:YggT family protein
LLDLYFWVILVGVIMSWLLMYNAINGQNQGVRAVYNFCTSLTEPVLRPIRQVIRPINGIDVSPVILILLIKFTDYCLWYYLLPLFGGYHVPSRLF